MLTGSIEADLISRFKAILRTVRLQMAQIVSNMAAADEGIVELIERHSQVIAAQLQSHHLSVFPPHAEKTIRLFQPAEAARLVGVSEIHLRNLANDMAPDIEVTTSQGGRRSYSALDMHKIRHRLDKVGRGSRRYIPHRREGEALQVISVMNFKGGSGKTTTAVHLAQFLSLRGYRVLAIDLDPQASLSTMLGVQPEIDVAENETLYGAIRYDGARPVREIVRGTYIPDLHLIPGNLELMEFEHDTPRALMKRKPGDVMFFERLRGVLQEVRDNYDVVIIDCPPQLGYLTLSALAAATSLLVTVHPQMLDVMSMNQFLSMMADLLREIAGHGAAFDYKWMRYLVTRFEPSDGPQTQMAAYLRAMFGENVLNHPMLKTTAVSDAGLTNQTLFEVDRGAFTRATYDRALDAMNNVNGEIESLIKKAWGRAA